MIRRISTLFYGAVVALSLSSAMCAQETPAPKKSEARAKQGRWEGDVVRSSPEKSTMTVRKVGSSEERTVHYDSATRWVSQEHGSKTVNKIDATQVKDGDRVIARGVWDNGVLYAT